MPISSELMGHYTYMHTSVCHPFPSPCNILLAYLYFSFTAMLHGCFFCLCYLPPFLSHVFVIVFVCQFTTVYFFDRNLAGEIAQEYTKRQVRIPIISIDMIAFAHWLTTRHLILVSVYCSKRNTCRSRMF